MPPRFAGYQGFNLGQRQTAVRQAAVHPAERAPVMGTALINLENQAVGFTRRTEKRIVHGAPIITENGRAIHQVFRHDFFSECRDANPISAGQS